MALKEMLNSFRLQAELDLKAKEFIEQDRVIFSDLNREMESFKEDPDSHPDYADQWRQFYNDKCFEARERINPISLKSAWAAEWDRYLNVLYRRRLTRLREELMKKMQITKDDIEDYLLRQKNATKKEKVPGSPVSSEENYSSRLSRQNFADFPANPSRPEDFPVNPAAPVSRETLKPSNTESGINVISTLRLMSAIEHLLDDLGIHVIQVSNKFLFFFSEAGLFNSGKTSRWRFQKHFTRVIHGRSKISQRIL
jgi:hypothetical protein